MYHDFISNLVKDFACCCSSKIVFKIRQTMTNRILLKISEIGPSTVGEDLQVEEGGEGITRQGLELKGLGVEGWIRPPPLPTLCFLDGSLPERRGRVTPLRVPHRQGAGGGGEGSLSEMASS